MTGTPGDFVWYELLTTDLSGAEAFYGHVMGWTGRDASTETMSYRLLAASQGPVCGLMTLPPEARAAGATPRWVGYVAVDDLDATVIALRQSGGRVFVPPTTTNIGKISIVADSQTASFALVQALTVAVTSPGKSNVGRVGWHELFATDCRKAFAFYRALFGWQSASDRAGPIAEYQSFSVGDASRGGIFNKLPRVPDPFWLYYFEVADLSEAVARVIAAGGRVLQGPIELPDDIWIARCSDPQGGMFALQGARADKGAVTTANAEVGWSAEWGGFTSRGRIVAKADAPSSRPKTKTATKLKSSPTAISKPPAPKR